MFHPFLYIPVTTTPLPFDIFEKYHAGMEVQHLPFRLYSIEHPLPSPVPTPAAQQPTTITRGPYRRYSRQEKESIILRMLEGATLKKISEETSIPKRNLIRWKHEFLHSKSIFAKRKSCSTVDECQSRRDPECIETKESISEEEQNILA